MTRQHIRLKEFDHNITKVHVPTEAYLWGASQLDKLRAYYQHTDNDGFIKTGNPGVYKLKVAANQDLPFVLEDIRFFSVNTEITFKKSCLCVE